MDLGSNLVNHCVSYPPLLGLERLRLLSYHHLPSTPIPSLLRLLGFCLCRGQRTLPQPRDRGPSLSLLRPRVALHDRNLPSTVEGNLTVQRTHLKGVRSGDRRGLLPDKGQTGCGATSKVSRTSRVERNTPKVRGGVEPMTKDPQRATPVLNPRCTWKRVVRSYFDVYTLAPGLFDSVNGFQPVDNSPSKIK